MREQDRDRTVGSQRAAGRAVSRHAEDRSDAAELRTRVEEEARALGFSMVGFADPAPSEYLPFYREWLERGLHGEMEYLAREEAVERRADVGKTLEDVRSVVVVAHEYYLEDAPDRVADPSRGVIARYARGRDYHKVVKKKLQRLGQWLEEELGGQPAPSGAEAAAVATPPVRWRAYTDTGPILERELARRAGLGWFGRNTMLIHPRRGSYFFLGVLLLDVELEPSEPFTADHCGSCRACLDACPTDALLGRDEEGAPVIDARRCISYLTIELRGPIPRELRPLMGNRVFGCDICQEVCPFNVRFAREATEPGYAAREPGESPVGVEALNDTAPHPGTASPSLIELLETALDEEAWDSFSRGSAIRRAGRAGFARNVCVALGNWGSATAVSVLTSALGDPQPLVRRHAAWALGRIASAGARAALAARLRDEGDPAVAAGIRVALTA